MRSTVLLLLAASVFLLHVASALKICAFNVQSFGEAKVNNKKVMGILLKVLYRKCWTKPATSSNRTESKLHLFLPPECQILSRCDLCLLQEVRDSKGEAVRTLVKDLNRYGEFSVSYPLVSLKEANTSWCGCRFDKANTYSYVESERLGRKSYKEQYVYIYRYDTGSVSGSRVDTTIPDVVPVASFLPSRSNVLKVKELYQYPRVDGAVSANETEVFSREPFIARFHSPTTRMINNVRKIMRYNGLHL